MNTPAPDDARCLERLFAPTSNEDFLAACWPGRHAVAHGPLERLGPLGGLPEFSSLERLLGSYRDRVRVALPGKRDEHSSIQVDAPTAQALHHSGMALILDGVERFLPVVQEWLERLRVELGLPRRCNPRCIVYVSPAGAGNSPHFDANANFVVQLHGTKRWHVAPNRHVRDPTDRWAMNQDALSEELEGYVEAPFPTELPEDAETIDLVPGSVLFVPRGAWHATEAEGDTLALNFTFGQPTWADLVLTALRRRLLADPSWRALPVGLFAPEPDRAAPGHARLLDLLAELPREVEQLAAAEVLDAMDAQPAYLLVPRGFLRVEGGVVLAALGDEGEFEIEAEEALHPVLEWIGRQRTPFSLEQVARSFPVLAPSLPALLQTLRANGLLERHHVRTSEARD
jgi:50S ribosomal protein L16 3-hydroxylase